MKRRSKAIIGEEGQIIVMTDNPFIYSNSILVDKKQLITDEQTERDYNPFLTNRALSQHVDLIYIANKVNEWHYLDNKLQFDYLLRVVPAKKRKFVKWPKRESVTPLQQAICEYYTINLKQARVYEKLLSDEQKDYISSEMKKEQ